MKYAVFAVALGGLAAPAFAGGLNQPVIEPAPAPAPVVAVPAGYDWTGFYGGAQLGYGNADAGDASGDGVIGGLNAGYRYDFGQFVAGVEADYDWADISLDNNAGSLDGVGRLKLIGGFDAGPALIYATAGAAWADASIGNRNLSDQGWFGGIGVAYPVADRVTVGAEILQHEFSDFDNSGVDVSATTATVRVDYRF